MDYAAAGLTRRIQNPSDRQFCLVEDVGSNWGISIGTGIEHKSARRCLVVGCVEAGKNFSRHRTRIAPTLTGYRVAGIDRRGQWRLTGQFFTLFGGALELCPPCPLFPEADMIGLRSRLPESANTRHSAFITK
jgi:hypothetical protein